MTQSARVQRIRNCLPALLRARKPRSGAVLRSPGTSFPQLRAGNYGAWSLLRLVTVAAANVTAMVNRSQAYVASVTPDYIPAIAVSGTNSDPGLQFHGHYHQRDGNDAILGLAPNNGLSTLAGTPSAMTRAAMRVAALSLQPGSLRPQITTSSRLDLASRTALKTATNSKNSLSTLHGRFCNAGCFDCGEMRNRVNRQGNLHRRHRSRSIDVILKSCSSPFNNSGFSIEVHTFNNRFRRHCTLSWDAV